MSQSGTKRTSSDVRYSVANGDKPDMERTPLFGSFGPTADNEGCSQQARVAAFGKGFGN